MNYMAVSEALSISPSTFGAGLAADDLILTAYFTAIYALAKNIPPDAPSGGGAINGTPVPAAPGSAGGQAGGEGGEAGGAGGEPGAAGGGGHGGGGERVISVRGGAAVVC